MHPIRYMMIAYACTGIDAIAVRAVHHMMGKDESQEAADEAARKWALGLAKMSGLIMGWVAVALVAMSMILWVLRQSSLPLSVTGWYSLLFGVVVIMGAGTFVRLIPIWSRYRFG